MNSVELCSGIGGMALGLSRAGFTPIALFENASHACEIVKLNRKKKVRYVEHWQVIQSDIRALDFSGLPKDIDLLAAGPPCQPFSFGGKHGGRFDRRNLFSEVIRSVGTLQPKAFLIENVKGMLRESFATFFEYVLLQLTYPYLQIKKSEVWHDHLTRLEQYHTKKKESNDKYNVIFRLINGADFGVPQKRERVFIVGFRSDLDIKWAFPEATHSNEALLWSQFVTGEYNRKHDLKKVEVSRIQKAKVENLYLFDPPSNKPWKTVRDAIFNLPPFGSEMLANHLFIPGARSYKGHTGSVYDEPAKTLKAGVHGVPGGENMLRYDDGKIRYFTLRECARLQTFPDDFVFTGAWSSAIRGLGNSVPVRLAEILGRSIYKSLNTSQKI